MLLGGNLKNHLNDASFNIVKTSQHLVISLITNSNIVDLNQAI